MITLLLGGGSVELLDRLLGLDPPTDTTAVLTGAVFCGGEIVGVEDDDPVFLFSQTLSTGGASPTIFTSLQRNVPIKQTKELKNIIFGIFDLLKK